MPSIIDTLEQEAMWYGQDGRPYHIAAMEAGHVENVLAFLRRRAADLRDHAEWLAMHRAGVRTLADAVTWRRQRRALGELEDEPAAWLERRPLVRVLERELRRRGSVEGEVIPEGRLAVTRPALEGGPAGE